MLQENVTIDKESYDEVVDLLHKIVRFNHLICSPIAQTAVNKLRVNVREQPLREFSLGK